MCHLREIKQYLMENYEMTCSTNTIARFLECKLITIKKARGLVPNSNSDTIKELRYKYAHRYIAEDWRKGRCIYIDEMGFNLWTRRQNGRSKIGSPVNVIVPPNRGGNITLILAISKKGPIYYEFHEGGVNHEIYQNFIEELSARLPDNNYHLIHDNAPIHNDAISIHRIYKLPPYSPFLNPIEALFAKLKREIRNEVSTSTRLISATNAERTSILKSRVQNALQNEEYKDLENYYRHCKKYLASCIEKSNIFGD